MTGNHTAPGRGRAERRRHRHFGANLPSIATPDAALIAPAPRSLWRDSDFQKWWWGQSVSLVGTQFSLLALPLAAAVTLRANPAEMGVLTAAQALPGLVFGPFAGIWLDRVRRRPVMIAAQLIAFAALATIPLTAVLHELSLLQLYIVSFATGTTAAFLSIAQNSFLPTLAGKDNLVDANAKYQTSMTTASLIGPGLAGFAVQVLTAPIAIAFDAASFLVGALTTAWVRVAEKLPVTTERRHLRAEIGEGLAFVTRQPQVRSILLTLILANWAGAVSQAVFVLVFVKAIGITPAQLGIVFAVGSLFSLAGAQLARRLVARFGVGPAMTAAALLFGAGSLAGIPAAFLDARVAFIWLLANSVTFGGLMVYNVNQQAIRGSVTPNRLLGRANAAVYVTVIGGRVLFALVGGGLGSWIGIRPTFVMASVMTATSALPSLMPAIRRLHEVPKAAD